MTTGGKGSDMNLAPSLPQPRGPLSERVVHALADRPRSGGEPLVGRRAVAGADPWGEDVHVALHTMVDLGYRGFAGVDPAWETAPGVTQAVNRLEDLFLGAVTAEVGPVTATSPRAVRAELDAIVQGDGPSLSRWIDEQGTIDHLREFAVHRSAYQLKEADPHTLALPRLAAGRAKAAFVEIQADEYGNGRPGQAHQELFAATMRELGLDDRYGAYVDHLPAVTLATVNLLYEDHAFPEVSEGVAGYAKKWLTLRQFSDAAAMVDVGRKAGVPERPPVPRCMSLTG